MKESENVEIKKAYLYLVKTPVSNDLTVCASDSKYYSGTHVVFPTKYGLDMGIVVGNASELGQEKYECGRRCVCGACHFGHPEQEFEDATLAAMGEPPHFEFAPYSGKLPMEDPEYDDSECWDSTSRESEQVEVDGDIDWISHMATPEEIQRYQNNMETEKKAIDICKEKIQKHMLDMKLVAAHFLLCEPKALFFFTAEDRVDFRELVKDLVSVFKMRIELRQIGVRDEARVLGGLAVCGRDFCCHCVSDKLNPVTIKMAKEQNLSLNSMKISGPCGRLLCCLGYEYDFYVEEKASYPPEGTKLKIGSELYTVREINILTKKIALTGPEGGELAVPRTEVWFSEKNQRWEVSRKFTEEFLSN